MKIETIDDMAPVMGADGEFHMQDDAVDLSGTTLEGWVALGFFWILGGTVFYQFFTRYVMNDSAAWTEEIAAVDLLRIGFFAAATVLTGMMMLKLGSNSRMTMVDLPMNWVYGVCLLGFAAMTFRSVQVALFHRKRGYCVLERPESSMDDK
jgi:TRAP-type C4-dicarboxylate transport system permease small subunit